MYQFFKVPKEYQEAKREQQQKKGGGDTYITML